MFDATPLLRLRASRRLAALARQDHAKVQAETLLGLIRTARTTAFGRAHGFGSIGSVAEYQARVPLRRYEDFWDRFWRPNFPYCQNSTWPGLVPYLAESSGISTGRTRYIPVTRPMLRANQDAARDVLAFHLAARPASALPGGRHLLLGGSTALRRMGPGVRSGDLSGIAAATMPGWARARTWPPKDIALLADWDEKLALIAAGAPGRDIRSLSGTPGRMLVLFERLAALHPEHPRTLAGLFPRLELIVHGGAGFAPYQPAFARWLDGSRAELREIYPASEGFIAAADRGPGEGLRLMLDHGLFMEFVPPEDVGTARPRRYWIGDAEPGRDYALALTSNAGLWSMLLGDRVRLLGLDPPRILMAGRLGQDLSLFGEHVTDAELDRAVAAAAAAAGCGVVEYTAYGFLTGDGRGRHLVAIEPASGGIDTQAFALALDRALRHGNADYATHRFADVKLLPPLIKPVPSGGFAQWMARRRKRGGQNKVPRVIAEEALLGALLGLQGDALRLVFADAAG